MCVDVNVCALSVSRDGGDLGLWWWRSLFPTYMYVPYLGLLLRGFPLFGRRRAAYVIRYDRADAAAAAAAEEADVAAAGNVVVKRVDRRSPSVLCKHDLTSNMHHTVSQACVCVNARAFVADVCVCV